MGIAELQKKYYRKFLINQHLPYSYNCILQIIKALRTLTAIRSFLLVLREKLGINT